MSELRVPATELKGHLDYDASRDSDAIEEFFRKSYKRTADLFHILVRPMKHALRRWANSDKPGARFLYEAAGIAVYVIAYFLIFALYIVLGGDDGGPRLPGFDETY